MPKQEKIEAQAEMLANRLIKKQKHLKKWAKRLGIGAYRLYDKDIPEIPLVLDYYHNGAIEAISGALYKRPYQKDETEERQWLECMEKAIYQALPIDGKHLFIKTRARQRSALQDAAVRPQYNKLSTAHFDMLIKEHNYLIKVNLSDYIDTGLFLDLRKLRSIVQQEAAGKKVLNLFCYTGVFSVAAGTGGAERVDSVDISNTYLRRTHDNLVLNGQLTKHHLIREDVFQFLTQAAQRKYVYDIIILDPPVFSASKKMEGTLDIKRDYGTLLDGCIKLLSPQQASAGGTGGKIYFSAKARGFKLDKHALATASPDILMNEISEKIRDEDFKGYRMPATYMIQRTSSKNS
ncbi:MAG: class I SAM-dependent methyltransferase [Spirochaetaceae bacterium]|jgi:23S rRNA G2069 N7-methylase RlmK/C1962 C5-methylase RlmI|nr:class I SAM-dependent methyltransferase [Spirochaetaceae bacterium]